VGINYEIRDAQIYEENIDMYQNNIDGHFMNQITLAGAVAHSRSPPENEDAEE
jgi:hypothetical protein